MHWKIGKNCLLPVSNQLAYCEENGIIYYGIDKTIIKYLNKHKCSSLIYRILINEAWIPEVKGETVKIYDTFIRKERDIKIKKDMLLDDSLDKDDEFVVLKYIESIYLDKKVFKSKAVWKIKQVAEEQNIVYADLLYKISYGVDINKAINIGKEESQKYGLQYLRPEIKNNFNFIQYFRWLAKQEFEGKDI